MSDEREPWVGDQVWDEQRKRDGYITDVRKGALYILRPVSGGTTTWVADRPDLLAVRVPREKRID